MKDQKARKEDNKNRKKKTDKRLNYKIKNPIKNVEKLRQEEAVGGRGCGEKKPKPTNKFKAGS